MLQQTPKSALDELQILDSGLHPSFDRITALTSRLLNAPVSLISFVDTDRVWLKSHHGICASQVDRVPGLCPSAIESDDLYIVVDAGTDPRTCAHPLVVGEMGLRFYAAAPLRVNGGVD